METSVPATPMLSTSADPHQEQATHRFGPVDRPDAVDTCERIAPAGELGLHRTKGLIDGFEAAVAHLGQYASWTISPGPAPWKRRCASARSACFHRSRSSWRCWRAAFM